MSWYGTTLYEFKKLFDKFRFKNNQKQNKVFPDLPEEDIVWEYQATSLNEYDALTITAGNSWLSFMPSDAKDVDPETNELLKHEVLLYHNPAQQGQSEYDKEVVSKEEITLDTTIDININPETEFINIYSRRFDAAGHGTNDFIIQKCKIDVSDLRKDIKLNADNIADIQAKLGDESLATQVQTNTNKISELDARVTIAEGDISNLKTLIGGGGEGDGELDETIATGIWEKINYLDENKLPYTGGEMLGTLKAAATMPTIAQMRNISLVSELDSTAPNLSNGDICIIYEETGVAGVGDIDTLTFSASEPSEMSTSINDIMAKIEDLSKSKVPYSGGVMTGSLIASSNTDYKVAQTRNIILLTKDTSAPINVTNGTICFFYSTSTN